MKTKDSRKDIVAKKDEDLRTFIIETREAIRTARFEKAGAAGKDIRTLRRNLARALTQLQARS